MKLMKSGHLLMLMCTLLCVSGCELMLDGENPRRAAHRPFFVVSEVSIEDGATEVALNQPITITFSEYLDPDSFDYFNAIRLRSGSISGPGWARYSLVDRSLTWYPTRELRSNLIYTLKVNPETVRSIFGEELALETAITFETAGSGTVEQNRRITSVSYGDSIAPILQRNCSCHNGDAELTRLEYENLVDVPSHQRSSRVLVVPFEPARSYLIHKLLDDYPYRRLEPMPPSWSAEPVLDEEALRLIESWVATGAEP